MKKDESSISQVRNGKLFEGEERTLEETRMGIMMCHVSHSEGTGRDTNRVESSGEKGYGREFDVYEMSYQGSSGEFVWECVSCELFYLPSATMSICL